MVAYLHSNAKIKHLHAKYIRNMWQSTTIWVQIRDAT
jgi:hypothetical protein